MSSQMCEDRIECDENDPPVATIKCEDCESYQCDACFSKIHDLGSGLRSHKHRRLNPEFLPCNGFCKKANVAEKYCRDCRLRLCVSCDEKLHAKGKRVHHERGDVTLSTNNGYDGESSQGRIQRRRRKSIDDDLAEERDDDDDDLAFETIGSVEAYGESPVDPPPGDDDDDDAPPREHSIETSSNLTRESFLGNPDERRRACNSILLVDGKEKLTPDEAEIRRPDCNSFLLVDGNEKLMLRSAEEFADQLKCSETEPVKVVCIVGNTGDGKSHTLNHAFFKGETVFSTSPHQSSCTVGVWSAYDPELKAIFLDTEGKLGVREDADMHTRLLMKILAISDVIIYRTKAERLHSDMYKFLQDASESYQRFFASQLKTTASKLNIKDQPSLGPALVVFHTTQHTDPLSKKGGSESMMRSASRRQAKGADEVLRNEFAKAGGEPRAYSSIGYEGYKVEKKDADRSRHSFEGLNKRVRRLLRDKAIRSARNPLVIFKSLEELNSKFSGKIERNTWAFPDEYFTCQMKCESCEARCAETMNHLKENIPHRTNKKALCSYRHEFENKIFLCRQCNDAGRRSVVVPKTGSFKDAPWVGLVKFAWSGYVLECKHCAVIYRSRQQWYGNKTPEEMGAVVTEIQHVWPGEPIQSASTENAARLVLEGVASAANRIGQATLPTTNALSDWVQDKLAPSYWVPNSQLKKCHSCAKKFTTEQSKHHCRRCGEGFCDPCSMNRAAVPSRGWGSEEVRVCDSCYEKIQEDKDADADDQPNDVLPRRMTEAVRSAYGAVANAMQYPKKGLVDSARPQYWVPDEDIVDCFLCREIFGGNISRHHCRACGQGVCEKCSSHRRSVPSRGWDHPTRVCDRCNERKDPL